MVLIIHRKVAHNVILAGCDSKIVDLQPVITPLNNTRLESMIVLLSHNIVFIEGPYYCSHYVVYVYAFLPDALIL